MSRLLPPLLALLVACVAPGVEPDPDPEPTPAPPTAFDLADPLRGGRLFDRWYAVYGVEAPEDELPATRCVACHGWDYLGRGGASGPDGAAPADGEGGDRAGGVPVDVDLALDPLEPDALFDHLAAGGVAQIVATDDGPVEVEMPAYGALLTDDDLWDLVRFVAELVPATAALGLSPDDPAVQGDVDRGRDLYQGSCVGCHGADGAAFPTGCRPAGDGLWLAETPGLVATVDPWRLAHKLRVGQPGVPSMSVAVERMEASDADLRDLLAFAAAGELSAWQAVYSDPWCLTPAE